MSITRYYYIFFVVIGLVFVQCYNSVDGCLDPESTNYSFGADEACLDDCCEYPTIKVNIYHLNEDTTFNLKDTLENNFGQEYSIVKYVYLLSDFVIETEEGDLVEVSDSVALEVDGDTIYTKDDIIRVSRANFGFTFGTIIFTGEGTNLSFKIGLSTLLNDNRFAESIDDHPLTTDPDSLYISESEEYVFQRIQIAQGVDFLDTVIYDVIGNTQEVSIPVEFTSNRGEDKTVIIEALYNKWFEDVNFNTMTKEEIQTELAVKSATMFRKRE